MKLTKRYLYTIAHLGLIEQAVRLGGRHNMPPPLLTVGQFRANLWSGGKNCPRPMCVPNLKVVASSVCEILALIDPVTLTFDLLTLKSVWESHVTWGTPLQSFVFLGLLVFELEPMYATSDRQTDDGRRSPLNAPPPYGAAA